MRFLDNRFYWWANRASSYLLLGGLWLLCSLPLLTLFPATAAMFATFRAWQDNPDDAFYLSFFARLRGYFLKDFLLGLGWLLFAGLLVLNALLLPGLSPALLPVGVALLVLAAVLYSVTTVFVFPLRASRPLSAWGSVQAALVLGMTQLGTTALCLLVWALVGLALWTFPPSLIVSVPLAGHLSYWLCERRLTRVFG